MTDNTEITFIQVNSSDYSTVGTPANFVNTLALPLVLDPLKDYEIAVYDVQFINRQGITPPISSVYLNSNLSDGNTIIGSQTTSTLLWIPWTVLVTNGIQMPSIGPNVYAVYWTTEKARKWYPMAKFKQITNINVSLTISLGDFIPSSSTDFTSITFGIREKF